MEIFGPHTPRVLAFLAHLADLAPTDIGTVTNVWLETDSWDRAEAWARVHRAVAPGERPPILAAAAVARRSALDVARRHRRPDWSFWAAASDAGAGIAARDLIGLGHYFTLVSPLAAVMPALLLGEGGGQTVGGLSTDEGAPGVLQQGA